MISFTTAKTFAEMDQRWSALYDLSWYDGDIIIIIIIISVIIITISSA